MAGLAGLADLAADNAAGSLPVDDRDDQPKERPEENDNVSRSPFGKRQRSVQLRRSGKLTHLCFPKLTQAA